MTFAFIQSVFSYEKKKWREQNTRKKEAHGRLPIFETSGFYVIRGKTKITFSAMMVSSILMYVKKSEISNSQTKLVNKEFPP